MSSTVKARFPDAPWKALLRRIRLSGLRGSRPAALSFAFIVMLIVAAMAADAIRPWDDRHVDLTRMLQPPSLAHPMGTDSLGRDLLAQVLHGLRVSFTVSAAAALLAVVIGTSVGLGAAMAGGNVDFVLMRGVDVFQAQNHFLLSILIAVLFRPVFGPGGAVMMAVSLTHWTTIARIVRAQMLSLREQPFVAAAVNLGLSRRHVVVRHYIPHLLPSVMLAFVLLVPHAIFHESGLSFLGLGMPPHQPSLGSLLAESRQTLLTGSWWLVVFPGATIFGAALAIGMLGEYWRARLHPRWRSELEGDQG